MRDLQPLVPAFPGTRAALHRVAEQLVAPARKPHNEIALVAIAGGFGTPVFNFNGDWVQVRVEGAELWVDRSGKGSHGTLTTLAAGAELIGSDLLPDGSPDDDTPLGIDPVAADQLGRWFAFGRDVLERLREEWRDEDPSDVHLWPEHFDIAIESGSEKQGRRANYGFSPGDADHADPYLYVGPQTAEVSGELWQATGFAGAELGYSEIVAAEDQAGLALEFCRARKQALDEPG